MDYPKLQNKSQATNILISLIVFQKYFFSNQGLLSIDILSTDFSSTDILSTFHNVFYSQHSQPFIFLLTYKWTQ